MTPVAADRPAPAPAQRPLHACVVVVTPRSFGLQAPGLRRQLASTVAEVRYRPGPHGADALADLLADADGLIAGLDEVSARVFEQAPRLRVVARYGTGLDRVDLAAAARHGVVVTTTPGANANAVAELTLALLFALARHLTSAHEQVEAGEWPPLAGIELAGRTLGLVGLGRIGKLVAAKAAGLDLRVLAHDPFVAPAETVELVTLDELASRSDIISLHAPLTERTRGLVGAPFLDRVRPGLLLINTARGELIDEAAVVRALDEGRIGGAALDVLSQEPPGPHHPLLGRADVLVTPHMAPHTDAATAAMGRIALEELTAVLAGRAPRFPA